MDIGTTVNLYYTDGDVIEGGGYKAYTSPEIAIPATYSADGASDWTFSYTYSAGIFEPTGHIVVTLITKKAGVVTAWDAKQTPLGIADFEVISQPWVVNGQTLTNTVGVTQGADSIRAAIAAGGGASGPSYDSVSNGTWIEITKEEYDQMTNIVPTSFTRGAIDDGTFSAFVGNTSNPGYSYFGGWDKAIPSTTTSKYMVAFATNFANVRTDISTEFRIKTSASSYTGYADYHGVLASPKTDGQHYYALRRPSSLIRGTRTGFYTAGLRITAPPSTGTRTGWEARDRGNFNFDDITTGLGKYYAGYQMIISTNKTW